MISVAGMFFNFAALARLPIVDVTTITFASLESHKIRGIVRLPREIDEESKEGQSTLHAR